MSLKKTGEEFDHLEEGEGAEMDVLPPACKEGQLLSLG